MAKTEQLPAVVQQERAVEFVPLGEANAIKISITQVQTYLATPTKRGAKPSTSDCIHFLMLCKARELNPWIGDAYLVGYDSKDGATFSLITAIQALLKRAEVNPAFNGITGGIVVSKDGGAAEQRVGTLLLPGDQLLGGWAAVHRKDRAIPYQSEVPLNVYNTGRSRWAVDPTGMIAKCAKAAALREAFPSQVGSLYLREELDHLAQGVVPAAATSLLESNLQEEAAAKATKQKPAAPKPESTPKPEPTEEPDAGQDQGILLTEYCEYIATLSEPTAISEVVKQSEAKEELTQPTRDAIAKTADARIKTLTDGQQGLFDKNAGATGAGH